MNSQEAIKAIKKLIFGDEEIPAAKVDMSKDYKLSDGTMANITAMEVGGTVMIGETVAPDGNYTLEDGTELTVMAGMISEIKPKVEMEAPKPIEPEPKVEARFSSLENLVKSQNNIIKEMFKLIENMSEVEVVKPIEPKKNWDDLSSLEKFRTARKNIK